MDWIELTLTALAYGCPFFVIIAPFAWVCTWPWLIERDRDALTPRSK